MVVANYKPRNLKSLQVVIRKLSYKCYAVQAFVNFVPSCCDYCDSCCLGYYALFQNTADPNITFVPGAAARFQVGNFFRNGAAPCKANFFYRLFGWSRLSLYQEVRGNVSLLWTQGGHVNPWMQAYVNIPPNPYGTVQVKWLFVKVLVQFTAL